MCSGDDHNCPEFELHRKKLLDDLDHERRSFLKSAFVAGGGAAAWAASGTLATPASAQTRSGQPTYHYLPANADTVHWGYFSKLLKPQLEVDSGDYVTIEAVTHHAGDDVERMVKGDPGVESIYLWTKDKKGVNRRGAGPMDGKRGAGEGYGVHICTGPVAIRGSELGDILEVRIMDVKPRPCANPAYAGKSFGSNAAAWWGFHYKDLLTEPKPREVCTIYEIDTSGQRNWAQAVYNFRWVPQTDPFGVVHNIIDYPGVPVDHSIVQENHNVLKNIRVPIRPHFGVMGVAPKEADIVNSIGAVSARSPLSTAGTIATSTVPEIKASIDPVKSKFTNSMEESNASVAFRTSNMSDRKAVPGMPMPTRLPRNCANMVIGCVSL